MLILGGLCLSYGIYQKVWYSDLIRKAVESIEANRLDQQYLEKARKGLFSSDGVIAYNMGVRAYRANNLKKAGEHFYDRAEFLNHFVFPATQEQFIADLEAFAPEIRSSTYFPGDVAEISSEGAKIHRQQSDLVTRQEDDVFRTAFNPLYEVPRIRTLTEDAEQIFEYKDSGFGAGVRLDRGHCKTVYLPWQDFFAVDPLENGDLVPRAGLVQAIEKILKWFGTNTDVQHAISELSLPNQCRLFYNYPNPFNGTTEIRYEIADCRCPSPTILKIYNILGQEVKTLLDQVQEPGYYTVTWDGRDKLGQEVPTGIYFYRLTAGDYAENRRMVLMK